MGARLKLNQGYATGSVIIACLAGGLLQSWVVFVVVLIILLVLNVSAGEIRLTKRGHRSSQ